MLFVWVKAVFISSKPDYVINLEAVYGTPSQAGFGSAVFYDVVQPHTHLEAVALRFYRYFVGDLWERFGETAWMSTWKQVYVRTEHDPANIITELRAIADSSIAQFVPVLLSVGDNSDQAQKNLAAAYNSAEVADLRIYAIGDGEAMSGLIIAGRRNTGETTVLVALLD